MKTTTTPLSIRCSYPGRTRRTPHLYWTICWKNMTRRCGRTLEVSTPTPSYVDVLKKTCETTDVMSPSTFTRLLLFSTDRGVCSSHFLSLLTSTPLHAGSKHRWFVLFLPLMVVLLLPEDSQLPKVLLFLCSNIMVDSSKNLVEFSVWRCPTLVAPSWEWSCLLCWSKWVGGCSQTISMWISLFQMFTLSGGLTKSLWF